VTDAEVNNMVGEAPGPINFTQMVTLFAEKMAGGNDDFKSRLFFSFQPVYADEQSLYPFISGTDDDDVIVRSFEAFEINGQIDAEM
jgi:hypothetical protein